MAMILVGQRPGPGGQDQSGRRAHASRSPMTVAIIRRGASQSACPAATARHAMRHSNHGSTSGPTTSATLRPTAPVGRALQDLPAGRTRHAPPKRPSHTSTSTTSRSPATQAQHARNENSPHHQQAHQQPALP